jgi:CRISPR-associated protein Csx10
MGSAWIRLTLRDELVLSESAATAGGHESLEYIPGATLLGVAARAYRAFGDEALAVFHGGAVRFGNATLEVEASAGMPMPLCWHERKAGPAAVRGGQADSDAIANYQHTTFERPIQPRQLRGGFLSPSGRVRRPEKLYRTKTAIEPGQRFAAESQLFSYESLAPVAGQRFVAPIQWDDSVSQDAARRLRATFECTTLRLGRSRSAEYGTVTAEWLDEESTDAVPPPDDTEVVTLWLLSDLAAEDDAGMPTLAPAPQDLGLPAGRLELSQSFLRSRRYSPFNAHYAAFERERLVIAQGSVLCYRLDERWTAEHTARASAGLGLYREAGLGRVAVNHPLLASPQPKFAAPTAVAQAPNPRTAPTMHPMLEWLEQRAGKASETESAQLDAVEAADEYERALKSARSYLGLGDADPVGPGASQWAQVAELANTRAGPAASGSLSVSLFDKKTGLCGRERSGWQQRIGQSEPETFTDWLKTRCESDQGRLINEPLRLHYLAREIRTRLQRESAQR